MTAQATGAADEVFGGTKPVEERHRIDEVRLAEWLKANVSGYRGPLTVSQFKGGQSNPTYRLDTPGRAYVLRRKPFGKLLPSAHAVDREFRVISALHKAGFRSPSTYGLCTDEGVIGAMFYIMECVEGRVLWDAKLPGYTPTQRRAIYEAEIATLAKLHNTIPRASGLATMGEPGNYFARQIDRWTKQYRASETKVFPSMEKLIEWLPQDGADAGAHLRRPRRLSPRQHDLPPDRAARRRRPRLGAVDARRPTRRLHLFSDELVHAAGRPQRAGRHRSRAARHSVHRRGDRALLPSHRPRDGIPDLNWYFSYNLFRLAGISQGIAGRVRDGTAASPRAAESGARAEMLADTSWAFAQKAGA